MTKPSIFRYEGHNYLVPFLIISSLFFMWGFAHGILEVLNPHFQESFHISKAMSALTQAAVYGAYFLMALPAGWIIRKWGYRRGVITGLVLFGIGALMFIPGSRINSFYFFVLSLFVIGCGLTCLETSANPYTTVLGHPDKAESRINLSQSLNGIGWIVGPLAVSFCSRVSTLPSLMPWWVSSCFLWHWFCQGSNCLIQGERMRRIRTRWWRRSRCE